MSPLTILKNIQRRPWAELSIAWRVVVVLILAGPPGIFSLLATLSMYKPQLEDMVDWMTVFILFELVDALIFSVMSLSSFGLDFARGKKRTHLRIVGVAHARIFESWILPWVISSLFPSLGDMKTPEPSLRWLAEHYPALLSQLQSSPYLRTRLLITRTVLPMCMWLVPAACICCVIECVRFRYFTTDGVAEGAGAVVLQDQEEPGVWMDEELEKMV